MIGGKVTYKGVHIGYLIVLAKLLVLALHYQTVVIESKERLPSIHRVRAQVLLL
jgi:hypothetical protein